MPGSAQNAPSGENPAAPGRLTTPAPRSITGRVTRSSRLVRLVLAAATATVFCAFHTAHAQRDACAQDETVIATPASLSDCLSSRARM